MTRQALVPAAERLFLDALFDGLAGFAFVIDVEGHFVRWNSGYRQRLGIGDEEMSALNAFDLVAARDRDRLTASLSDVLSGDCAVLECTLCFKEREIPIFGTGLATEFEGKTFIVGTMFDTSQLLAARDALTNSELRYRQIFNATSDGIVIHGADGRIIDLNEQMCALFGCERDLLIGKNAEAFEFSNPPYSHADAHEKLRTATEQGPQLFEWPCKRTSGERYWAEVALRATEMSGEHCVIASVRDISARKQAEAALQINERRLALAVSATEDAVWEYLVAERSAYFSPRWYTMLGYTEHELPMALETYRMLCHPDDLEVNDRRLAELLGSDESQRYESEFRMRRADGSWAWIMGRGAVTERDADGKALVISGTNTDITRRRQAEHDVAEWKQRYDLLTRAAGHVVYDCSVNGDIVWGGVVSSVLGYSDQELRGGVTQWKERIHPDDRERVVRKYASAVAAESVFVAEYRFRHKTGQYLAIQDTGYPQVDDSGNLVRYVGVMADVSERNRADAERRRLEDVLRQAQKMESMGRLAGGIAHDFNNLLTAIGGNLSLAELGDGLDRDTQELLQEAMKATDSAANLTRQLLTFSRKQVIHPKATSLNETVWALQKMLKRLLGEDVELTVKLDVNLGQVEIDEGQIEQVLVNLSVNARDAMPDGGKLTIESANVDLDAEYCRQLGQLVPGNYVMLAVSDDGIGMSPEVKSHLFEPFFTTKAPGKGTGLGLAMVYGAVQQNHGHVSIYSEPGFGTTVRIYLPRCDAPTEVAQAPNPILVSRGKESIFVVEDDDQVRALAVRILRRHGYEVQSFNNGEDALLALAQRSQPVHLLLTDVVMPGMNGKMVAERALAIQPSLRVLYTSGYTEDVIMHHGVLDAGIEFIAKPYSVASLTERLRELLDRA